MLGYFLRSLRDCFTLGYFLRSLRDCFTRGYFPRPLRDCFTLGQFRLVPSGSGVHLSNLRLAVGVVLAEDFLVADGVAIS